MKIPERVAADIVAHEVGFATNTLIFGRDHLRKAITSALLKARADAITEAANVAEQHHVGGMTAMNIANKIRLLSNTPAEGETK